MPKAANYLDIESLLDLTCQTVADMIKGKTADEIRNTFNIENDFTPEEEEEIRRENQWAKPAFPLIIITYTVLISHIPDQKSGIAGMDSTSLEIKA
ncbi:unnamed protein product [Ilex paraguariensis]|uniref:SKP1 component dimerisation domain-containing protein n=1 Tax=Ilex paraguariensis TaxID=185542 RepID=A0ABC8SJC0_9AQUA